jgi:cupin fold WbuC family metalloprotein
MEKLNFNFSYTTPIITSKIKKKYCDKASNSLKRRYPLILHDNGAEFNQVVNFICIDSYMRPHLHPYSYMIEEMYLIEGSFILFFFDDKGSIIKKYLLNKPGQKVRVPAMQWHTYIMKSQISIIYETMNGKYNPLTWKKMADWSPEEGTPTANKFFETLKNL